ncbi:MAG: hypothetical protein HOP00_02320 [Nitrospira sp.]|nr:hypothetical protein [Nitrospira sp.]
MIAQQRHHAGRLLVLGGLLLALGSPLLAHAVPMVNDPNGSQGMTWGVALTARPDFEITQPGPHVNEFQLKNSAPSYAGVPVDSVRFLAVDDQFARVTIRYQGDDRHKQILTYLEQQFGSLERIPGQMMRGLNQQYTWRGADTEINLTYHANTERGYLFIDSRTLAPRFNDRITDSAE